MAYDQNSFLQGIAVGRSMKGWSCGVGTSVPKAWNDEGIYTYLYIDYHLPISGISVSLFRLSTRIMCEAGEIEIEEVESVDSTTFRIYCDLTKAGNGWVAVIGYNSSWLFYDNGYSIPEYSSVFWVDGKQTWTPGYLEDTARTTAINHNGTEHPEITYQKSVRYAHTEELKVPKLSCAGEESLKIRYS